MKSEAMKDLKLTSTSLDTIAKRLQELVLTNSSIPELAYAGVYTRRDEYGCGCKGTCDGGCTSW